MNDIGNIARKQENHLSGYNNNKLNIYIIITITEAKTCVRPELRQYIHLLTRTFTLSVDT